MSFFWAKATARLLLAPSICTGGDYPVYPVVGDFNGDGKLDAFIPMLEEYGVNSVSGPVLLQGNGDGTFNRIGEFYVGATSHAAVVADFNGDGTPDIAVLNDDDFAIGYLHQLRHRDAKQHAAGERLAAQPELRQRSGGRNQVAHCPSHQRPDHPADHQRHYGGERDG